MRTGYFGTFNEPNEFDETRRAILHLRRNADQAEAAANKSPLRTSGITDGATASQGRMTQYLCVVQMSGGSHSHVEQFYPAEDARRAIITGVHWARCQKEACPARVQIVEVRISSFETGGKDSTLVAKPCFHWKHNGTMTLEQELDGVLAAMFLSKLDELEAIMRRIEKAFSV
ncbi:MAG: hypothetical protein HY360_19670 [Verrucomicrobia bacterium]|nr:hypothetical protein [Verrucomicrobiota bacterium]